MLKCVIDVLFRLLHEQQQGTNSQLMTPLTASGFGKTTLPKLTGCLSPLPLKYLNASSTTVFL